MADRNIFFLLFDNVEVLDFSGPFDVFSMSMIANADKHTQVQPDYFDLRTVSQTGEQVTAIHGLKVVPDYGFHNCPTDEMDVLVIPGGTIETMTGIAPEVVNWIAEHGPETEVLASVCVGGLILAKTGMLRGLRATTHHGLLDMLRGIAPGAIVEPGARYVDNSPDSNIMMSAGVSAGIDLAFHMLRGFVGDDATAATASLMEYNGTANWVTGP